LAAFLINEINGFSMQNMTIWGWNMTDWERNMTIWGGKYDTLGTKYDHLGNSTMTNWEKHPKSYI